MKQGLRCQRILILSLLSLSVLAPVAFLSARLGSVSPSSDRKKEFEDIPGLKHYSDAFQLNSIWQEGGEGLKEPVREILKDKDFIEPLIDQKTSADNVSTGGIWDGGENVISSDFNGSRIETDHEQVIGVTLDQNVPTSDRTMVQDKQSRREANGHSGYLPDTYAKIYEMKDQLIMARAYLQFSPPNSNSHIVRELRLRIKEIERIVAQVNKDSDLPRGVMHKMKKMEALLSKASQLYPDCHAMATKLRAMAYNTEEQLRTQKHQTAYLIQLTSKTFPKSLHCLSLQLTSEYFNLQHEDRELLKKDKVQQADLYHYAIFSDNLLACSVVINSTISSSGDPSKIVFHVVTDSLNFPAMKMWFLMNPTNPATIHIKNMDDFDWLPSGYMSTLKRPSVRDPRYISGLNHLRFYLPQIFPYLNKVLLLDHDVVIQRDLRKLWKVDMKGKVNGAVGLCRKDDSSRRLEMFIDFTDPNVAKQFDPKSCAWAFGMNIFDLKEWRRQRLTNVYQKWMQLAKRGGNSWKAGTLPLGLVTFYNHTLILDRRWHVLGLGYDPTVGRTEIERAAVIHYNGNMKPWLEFGIPKYRSYWTKFVNYGHPYLQQCNVHE
ncbi:hypothetical protein Taro_013212 [Colocasia esculenta]|uniref:Hexosyltransferase n=1 Tax=Colocasia esculenta TaxID=4460 RepID=A0A843UAZ1_COLES|nr:hypothetical protein [Colocasia esculenta]